ncbi:unnamed protein product [Vitrella brassicaformis CCMP3155]|uniref:RING-type domain-containing protein n=2 Tax=Vitrella brassicaformis TaxID=1169539 RepID=A0A0G4EVG5_VITBC|nr:unnamed protein product [Vitrella brassicaformis CCMP3155]|eukprot:CEM02065.1 unnamed protein product [Vitrella brassicaformis CCMP3155]
MRSHPDFKPVILILALLAAAVWVVGVGRQLAGWWGGVWRYVKGAAGCMRGVVGRVLESRKFENLLLSRLALFIGGGLLDCVIAASYVKAVDHFWRGVSPSDPTLKCLYLGGRVVCNLIGFELCKRACLVKLSFDVEGGGSFIWLYHIVSHVLIGERGFFLFRDLWLFKPYSPFIVSLTLLQGLADILNDVFALLVWSKLVPLPMHFITHPLPQPQDCIGCSSEIKSVALASTHCIPHAHLCLCHDCVGKAKPPVCPICRRTPDVQWRLVPMQCPYLPAGLGLIHFAIHQTTRWLVYVGEVSTSTVARLTRRWTLRPRARGAKRRISGSEVERTPQPQSPPSERRISAASSASLSAADGEGSVAADEARGRDERRAGVASKGRPCQGGERKERDGRGGRTS